MTHLASQQQARVAHPCLAVARPAWMRVNGGPILWRSTCSMGCTIATLYWHLDDHLRQGASGRHRSMSRTVDRLNPVHGPAAWPGSPHATPVEAGIHPGCDDVASPHPGPRSSNDALPLSSVPSDSTSRQCAVRSVGPRSSDHVHRIQPVDAPRRIADRQQVLSDLGRSATSGPAVCVHAVCPMATRRRTGGGSGDG